MLRKLLNIIIMPLESDTDTMHLVKVISNRNINFLLSLSWFLAIELCQYLCYVGQSVFNIVYNMQI